MVAGKLIIKTVGKLGSLIIGDKVVDAAVGWLSSEEGRQQIIALGQSAGNAAKNGAAAVNRKMPWYRDLAAEYTAIAAAVEQVGFDIAAATQDPTAPVERWTARLQKINTAIPQAHAAIGRDELKRVSNILKTTRKLQAEIYKHTMRDEQHKKFSLPKFKKPQSAEWQQN